MTDNELIDSLIPQHLQAALRLRGFDVYVDDNPELRQNVSVDWGDNSVAWRFADNDPPTWLVSARHGIKYIGDTDQAMRTVLEQWP